MDALQIANKLGGGHFLEELHAHLLRVAEDVIATKKKGKVTVTLDVEPSAQDIVVVIRETFGVTLPKTEPMGAMFFVHEGGVHTRDPRQTEMEFRVVDGGKPEFRTPEEKQDTVRKVEEN